MVDTVALGAGATDVAAGQVRCGSATRPVTASSASTRRQSGHGVDQRRYRADGDHAGFGSVWVANSLDGTLSRIDPQTNAVTATVAVGDGVGGSR